MKKPQVKMINKLKINNNLVDKKEDKNKEKIKKKLEKEKKKNQRKWYEVWRIEKEKEQIRKKEAKVYLEKLEKRQSNIWYVFIDIIFNSISFMTERIKTKVKSKEEIDKEIEEEMNRLDESKIYKFPWKKNCSKVERIVNNDKFDEKTSSKNDE